MKELKHILSYTRRAVADYGMIAEGDRIAVGVSAGKDSLTLLYALAALRRFYPIPFELVAVTVDMGFPGMDFSPIAELCASLEVPYHIVPTQISHIIFDVRKEKNPCSLCAKMRRGALHAAAGELGCNRVALGHHFDDVVETFMLNLMQTGRIGCFMPVTEYPDTGLAVIRPLIYTEENDLRRLVKAMDLPVYKNPCPEDGATERASMKDYLRAYDRDRSGLYRRILGALERSGTDGWHE